MVLKEIMFLLIFPGPLENFRKSFEIILNSLETTGL